MRLFRKGLKNVAVEWSFNKMEIVALTDDEQDGAGGRHDDAS